MCPANEGQFGVVPVCWPNLWRMAFLILSLSLIQQMTDLALHKPCWLLTRSYNLKIVFTSGFVGNKQICGSGAGIIYLFCLFMCLATCLSLLQVYAKLITS